MLLTLSLSIPNKRAKKNVMAGREAVVAAAKVADVYDNAIPFKSKLNVTPNKESMKILMKVTNERGGALFRSKKKARGAKKMVAKA
jgi:hypothetical protein